MSESSYHLKNLYKLSELVAVVTGGGTGIGLMVARGLAENGASVHHWASERCPRGDCQQWYHQGRRLRVCELALVN